MPQKYNSCMTFPQNPEAQLIPSQSPLQRVWEAHDLTLTLNRPPSQQSGPFRTFIRHTSTVVSHAVDAPNHLVSIRDNERHDVGAGNVDRHRRWITDVFLADLQQGALDQSMLQSVMPSSRQGSLLSELTAISLSTARW